MAGTSRRQGTKLVDNSPPGLILARRGARELRQVPAHYRTSQDEWGTLRERVRACVVAVDTRSSTRQVLWEGACNKGRIKSHRKEIASFLGISEEQVERILPGQSITF